MNDMVYQIIRGLDGKGYVSVEDKTGRIVKGKVKYYGCDDEDEIGIWPDGSSTGVLLLNSDIKRIISFSND